MNMSESFSMPFVALTIGDALAARDGAAARATSRVAWLGDDEDDHLRAVEGLARSIGGA